MKLGLWRRLKMVPIRLRLGFWPYEVWNLDMTIAAFAAPRLKYLSQIDHGHPCGLTPDEWRAIQDEIIWALEAVADDSSWYGPDYDYEKVRALEERRSKGCKLFGFWFQALWD